MSNGTMPCRLWVDCDFQLFQIAWETLQDVSDFCTFRLHSPEDLSVPVSGFSYGQKGITTDSTAKVLLRFQAAGLTGKCGRLDLWRHAWLCVICAIDLSQDFHIQSQLECYNCLYRDITCLHGLGWECFGIGVGNSMVLIGFRLPDALNSLVHSVTWLLLQSLKPMCINSWNRKVICNHRTSRRVSNKSG